MILIVTDEREGVGYVTRHLDELGQRYAKIILRRFVDDENRLSIILRSSSLPEGCLVIGDQRFDFSEIKSIWYRRPKPICSTRHDSFAMNDFIRGQFSQAFWSFACVSNSFWMNHPLAGYRIWEENKLLQLRLAATVGFRVPETVIGNDPDVALNALLAHGDNLIVKLTAGSFYENDKGQILTSYSTPITRDELLEKSEDVALAPVIVQEYIKKKHEIRATVIGERVLACAIFSQENSMAVNDWRQCQTAQLRHEIVELPPEVNRKLIAFMRSAKLAFAAIDLVVTPDDEYVFLEANPDGQYLWIENLTGLPISRAIAEALIDPPLERPVRGLCGI